MNEVEKNFMTGRNVEIRDGGVCVMGSHWWTGDGFRFGPTPTVFDDPLTVYLSGVFQIGCELDPLLGFAVSYVNQWCQRHGIKSINLQCDVDKVAILRGEGEGEKNATGN